MGSFGVRRITGKLILNPTNITAFPYGGIEMGTVRDGRMRLGQTPLYEEAEEWGGQPVDVIQSETVPMFVAIMAEWSNEGVSRSLSGATIGAVTRRAVQTHDQIGATRAGTSITKGGKLLVAPDSPQDQAVIIYNAIPHPAPDADPAWTEAREWGIPMVWVAGLDIQKRTYQISPVAGIVL